MRGAACYTVETRIDYPLRLPPRQICSRAIQRPLLADVRPCDPGPALLPARSLRGAHADVQLHHEHALNSNGIKLLRLDRTDRSVALRIPNTQKDLTLPSGQEATLFFLLFLPGVSHTTLTGSFQPINQSNAKNPF